METNNTQEQQWLAKVAEGDKAAFEALYRCYYSRLKRFLGRVLNHTDSLLEDVLNETMYQVWVSAGGFKGNSKVSTWIFAIAYNKALKALKKEQRFSHSYEVQDSDQVYRPMLLEEQKECLEVALAELSPDHRAVVELGLNQGVNYAEVGAILDIPENTVKTRMFYARRQLCKILDQMGCRESTTVYEKQTQQGGNYD